MQCSCKKTHQRRKPEDMNLRGLFFHFITKLIDICSDDDMLILCYGNVLSNRARKK